MEDKPVRNWVGLWPMREGPSSQPIPATARLNFSLSFEKILVTFCPFSKSTIDTP